MLTAGDVQQVLTDLRLTPQQLGLVIGVPAPTSESTEDVLLELLDHAAWTVDDCFKLSSLNLALLHALVSKVALVSRDHRPQLGENIALALAERGSCYVAWWLLADSYEAIPNRELPDYFLWNKGGMPCRF